MSSVYRVVAECSPSSKPDSYVYAIVPTASNSITAITSADELVVVNRDNLSSSEVLRASDVPPGVSTLKVADQAGNLVLCSGSDGTVASFDIRTQQRIGSFKMDQAVTALAARGNLVAVGTELAHHQAIVSVWDQRQNKQLWQNAENNDDITALDFHPSKQNILLSGGDDGQVSIFDTNVAEEDDSLLQGVSHGPIHKAGFLGESRFFALSSDQNLAVHPISSSGDDEDPAPTMLGDLRPSTKCEYVIDVFRSGDSYVVAAGSNNNDARIQIIDLRHATNMNKSPKLKLSTAHTLEGAHGEEVVRSIIADESGIIFTAGEDGKIKAFASAATPQDTPTSAKSSKHKKGSEARFKPY